MDQRSTTLADESFRRAFRPRSVAILGASNDPACDRSGRRTSRAAPDFIATEMVQALPTPRAGTLEDVANTVAFLVSTQPSYITRETLHVTGGRYHLNWVSSRTRTE